jgi:hypothetical protein
VIAKEKVGRESSRWSRWLSDTSVGLAQVGLHKVIFGW